MGHLDSIFFFSTINNNIVFEVEYNELYFGSMSETQPDYLTSSLSWYVVSKPSWITVNPSSGSGSTTLNITVEENISGLDRSGTIKIGGGGKTITITVIQYCYKIPR